MGFAITIQSNYLFIHSQFDWHRDSDYYQDLEDRMEPTVACWTCLDNVAESNGTVELVDFKGQPYVFEATAGSILFMSNRLLHKSTGNATSKFRRAFMPQYSKQPMMKSNQCLAIQCDSVCLSYLHLSREKLPEFT
ncbi:uncharacterized protein B0P05DRAFT_576239 [Gilbertella persicaria]|uniref:uncharacterized protein n=1 Tax=Gilbertella persicaria TaxID=101096 RepID=UPI00221F581E|nr:uncharacterized protein B0P05DRAFT_576239 [Gilbertella persicaria]KAI8047675.1 hypothetical protein B0P05DRAFT_576239 [Gilbertella persicaria]